MYSCGPPHMDGQKQDDQHELTFSSYVRIRDVALPEDLPEAMNDREKLRESVRDIHTSGTTWWWLCQILFIRRNQTYIIRKHVLLIRSLNQAKSSQFYTQLNGFENYYIIVIIRHQSFVSSHLNRYTWYVGILPVISFLTEWEQICLHTNIAFVSTQLNHHHHHHHHHHRAGSTDIPDPLSPLLPIVHRPR